MLNIKDSDKWYLHSNMCRIQLPRSDCKSDIYYHSHANWSIAVQAGSIFNGDRWIKQLIPYGTKARLLLYAINTYAVQCRTREIYLGDSFNQLLRSIGLTSQGGRHGPNRYVKRQINALAACKLGMGSFSIASVSTQNIQLVNKIEGISLFAEETNSPTPIKITLSHDYFLSLLDNNAVPLKRSHILQLKKSSLALDIYTWLALRFYEIDKQRKKPLRIYWHSLYSQFGQSYADKKNFKKDFLVQIQKVLDVYPEAQARKIKGGIVLSPSPTPVPEKIMTFKASGL